MYEKLWVEALATFAHNKVHLDPHLPDKAQDPRRGVTIALRPSVTVLNKIKPFTDELATICPGQYFYLPEELHVTVLSLISGTIHWRKEMRPLIQYRAIVNEVLRQQPCFNLEFHGITASPAAIMIQGFVPGNELNQLRARLREAFVEHGFKDALDRRYKIANAHITVMRFQKNGANLKLLVPFLKAHRETDFGSMSVEKFQLVFGDWYASDSIVRTLQEYSLKEK